MRWYAQDEVNQEDSEQNEFDRMKNGYWDIESLTALAIISGRNYACVLHGQKIWHVK